MLDDECSPVKYIITLVRAYGPANRWQLVPGGTLGLQAFKESRLCYLNGCYVACVCVSQMALEQILAGIFAMEPGHKCDRAGFGELLLAAVEKDYISRDEFEAFDSVREKRNMYAHFSRPLEPGTPNRRAVEADIHPKVVYKADAEMALTALCRLLARPPFAVLDD